MNGAPGLSTESRRTQGLARNSRWRLIVLILGFNVLLIATLFLSMQHEELTKEYQLLVETRTVYEELVVTQEVTELVTITVVVAPGFTPQANPTTP